MMHDDAHTVLVMLLLLFQRISTKRRNGKKVSAPLERLRREENTTAVQEVPYSLAGGDLLV
jgi:hypothetical protein